MAAAGGSVPRMLELVQFLSIYCTVLSSQQQEYMTAFQTGSFTGALFSNAETCRICPGFCLEPLVLVFPTLAFITSLAVLAIIIAFSDAYACKQRDSRSEPNIMALLLSSGAASSSSEARGPASGWRRIAAFCTRFLRVVVEALSSYMLIPATFVFVINVWPSSFVRASASEQAMIILIPLFALFFRSFVIHRRLLKMTSSDQKQLHISSVFNCSVIVVLSVYFVQDLDLRRTNPSFSANAVPQYIVLALFAIHLVALTVLRRNTTEPSLFHRITLPWRPLLEEASSYEGQQAPSKPSSSRNFRTVAAEFIILNHLILSQMTMVIIGLTSSATYESSVAITVIGVIPLVISSFLLLNTALKFVTLMWRLFKRNCGKKTKQSIEKRGTCAARL